ncbi:hypothetical protein ES703_65430 [subsurface metagenome]
MKITLKIPDDIVEDFAERNLYVFAGIDLVAHKYRGEKNWTVKIQRCSQCGTCCQNLKEEHPFPLVDGRCIYLTQPEGYGGLWFCSLGINRPFGCAIANNNATYCSVKYEYENKV